MELKRNAARWVSFAIAERFIRTDGGKGWRGNVAVSRTGHSPENRRRFSLYYTCFLPCFLRLHRIFFFSFLSLSRSFYCFFRDRARRVRDSRGQPGFPRTWNFLATLRWPFVSVTIIAIVVRCSEEACTGLQRRRRGEIIVTDGIKRDVQWVCQI